MCCAVVNPTCFKHLIDSSKCLSAFLLEFLLLELRFYVVYHAHILLRHFIVEIFSLDNTSACLPLMSAADCLLMVKDYSHFLKVLKELNITKLVDEIRKSFHVHLRVKPCLLGELLHEGEWVLGVLEGEGLDLLEHLVDAGSVLLD